jgi:hypothetical protein
MIAQIDLLIKGANYVSEALGGGKLIDLEPLKEANKFFDSMAEKGAKLLFDPEQVKADGIKLQEETQKQLTDLKNKRAGYVLAVQQIDKQGSQIDKQGSQTAVDTKKKELDALIELEIKKANTDEKILKDLLDKRLALENLSGAQLELARENNAEKLRKAIDEDNNNLLKQETVKIDKLKILGESRTQTLQGQLNEEVEAERKAAELKTKILEAQAVRAQRIDEQANSFKVKSIQQGLEIVSSITELFGKKSEKQAKRAFQVQKAAQVASALINTYQSATGAYASQFLPVPDPTSPVRGGIAAGLAVAAGLVNVAKIASQKFEGGSTGGGGGTPGGNIPDSQMAAPQFNTIGTSGINQLATLQQQPTKAYVVSGEVTSAQSLDRNRLQNATL